MSRLDEIKARLDAAKEAAFMLTTRPVVARGTTASTVVAHECLLDAPTHGREVAQMLGCAPSDLRYLIAEVERHRRIVERAAVLDCGFKPGDHPQACSKYEDLDCKCIGCAARAALDGGSDGE